MKKYLVVVAAIAMVIALGTSVYAANYASNTVTVSTSVTGICKFDANTSTITVPALDPSNVGVDGTGSTSGLNYACTMGDASFHINQTAGANGGTAGALGGSLNLKDTVSGDTIPYTLGQTGLATGAGFSSFVPVTITATIPYAGFKDAHAGSYADTVVLTILY
jgi:hypothetical protein